MPPTNPNLEDDASNSLEGTSTVVESNTPVVGDTSAAGPPTVPVPPPSRDGATAPPPKPKIHHHFLNFLKGVNIYILSFVFVLIIAVIVIVIAATTSSSNSTKGSLISKNLTASQLAQIASNQPTVIGNASQVLNIASNAIFDGQVLIKQSLDVAGSLQLGQALSAPSLNIPGSASLGQITTNSEVVSGDSSVGGQLTVGKNLTVNGTTNFSNAVSINQLTLQSLQLAGDLSLSHHLDTNGGAPNRTSGTALGTGGTTSVSGTDTAGTLSVNTGSSPSAGCFATIYFTTKFAANPHVGVTPVGSAAAGLSYYVDRSTTSLSICSLSAPPPTSSFAFDYLVID